MGDVEVPVEIQSEHYESTHKSVFSRNRFFQRLVDVPTNYSRDLIWKFLVCTCRLVSIVVFEKVLSINTVLFGR